MRTKQSWSMVVSVVALALVASPAMADVPNDPCEGAEEGDDCGSGRTCQEVEGGLVCTADEGGCAVSAADDGAAPAFGLMIAAAGVAAVASRRRKAL